MPSLVTTTPALSMLERRPEWLDEILSTEYARSVEWDIQISDGLVDEKDRGVYGANGELETNSEYLFTEGEDESTRVVQTSSGLIEELSNKQTDELQILDIGAGAGGFLINAAQAGHNVTGISHRDYRILNRFEDTTTKLDSPNIKYVVGDAQNLASNTDIDDAFDLIVSRLAFIHMLDPIGALEQAINKLRVGGVMAIDWLELARIGNIYDKRMNHADLLDGIRSSGVNADGWTTEPYFAEIKPLIVTRTKPDPVKLPFIYRLESPFKKQTWF